MKVRIKETGQIFNVEEFVLDDGYNYEPKDIDVIIEEYFDNLAINWEHRRFELVKAAMQGLSILRVWNNEQELAELTIKVADAVLAEYRKEEK